MLTAGLLVTYVLVSAYGLYRLKLSAEFLDVSFNIGIVFYGLGFLIWLYILKLNPLSFAFPIAAGALIVSTSLAGFFLLGESMSALKMVGIMMIVTGIFFVYLRG